MNWIELNWIWFFCKLISIVFFPQRTANDFLGQLALENNGRFHKSFNADDELHLLIHRILTEEFNENYVSIS